jgi:hypothetical protein
MDGIEARLQRLEDRASLDDLVVRYFVAADGDDYEGIGDCFTDDATFGSSGTVNGLGREAIVDFIRTARGHMGLTVHTPNYALYTFRDDDSAKGLVGAHLELILGGEMLFGAVRYVDTYRRNSNGWRIAERDMRTIYIAPWREVDISMASAAPVRWPAMAPAVSDVPRRVD